MLPIKDRIVVSVNLGMYDTPIEDHYDNDWTHYLITDDWNYESDFWKVLYIPEGNKRQSRLYKWVVHRFFEADISLYIDANIRILTNLDDLVDRYLDGHDIAMYKHRCRDCLYSEAEICKHFGLDNDNAINRQTQRYLRAGYPAHNGLNEGCVILRRHTDKIEKLNELVWSEISSASYRDQISFNYCAWKLGVNVNNFYGAIKLYDEAKESLEKWLGDIEYINPYFEMEPHNV